MTTDDIANILTEVQVAETLLKINAGNPLGTDVAHLCRHVRNLVETLQIAEEQFQVACRRSEEWKEKVSRLELLLMRKNAALDVFAGQVMWERDLVVQSDQPDRIGWYWQGAAEYADPQAFAQRERDAEEPCG